MTWQSLRAGIGPLQFSLRHWNLRNLTLQTCLSITREFFRLHITFARLYKAAASPASGLRSAGSLAITMIIVFSILYNNMISILYSTSRTGVFSLTLKILSDSEFLMSTGSAFQSRGALVAKRSVPIKLSFSFRYGKKHLSQPKY